MALNSGKRQPRPKQDRPKPQDDNKRNAPSRRGKPVDTDRPKRD